MCETVQFRIAELACRKRKVLFLTKAEALNIAAKIQDNYLKINDNIAQGKTYSKPSSAEGFVALLRTLHRRLFKGTKLSGIGRFRTKNEQISIDINNNRFDGTPPSHIEKELNKLWLRIETPLQSINSQESYRDFVADFLPHFFRIHPFLDGNGRVGRAFVRIVGLESGYDFLDHRKHRGLYVRSLRYTHRLSRDQNLIDERKKRCMRYTFDHLWLFKLYVDKQIRPVFGDDLVEEEPGVRAQAQD